MKIPEESCLFVEQESQVHFCVLDWMVEIEIYLLPTIGTTLIIEVGCSMFEAKA